MMIHQIKKVMNEHFSGPDFGHRSECHKLEAQRTYTFIRTRPVDENTTKGKAFIQALRAELGWRLISVGGWRQLEVMVYTN